METKTIITEEIAINAGREIIWNALTQNESARKWLAAFMPGIYIESDWQQDGPIRFIGKDGQGILGRITTLQPGHDLKVTYEAILKENGIDTSSEDAKKWSGGWEHYEILSAGEDNGYILRVRNRVEAPYADKLQGKWANALEIIKKTAENA